MGWCGDWGQLGGGAPKHENIPKKSKTSKNYVFLKSIYNYPRTGIYKHFIFSICNEAIRNIMVGDSEDEHDGMLFSATAD